MVRTYAFARTVLALGIGGHRCRLSPRRWAQPQVRRRLTATAVDGYPAPNETTVFRMPEAPTLLPTPIVGRWGVVFIHLKCWWGTPLPDARPRP
jgi:hypothetical protein